MKIEEITAPGIRFSIMRGELEVGRAFLYLLHNDKHTERFGFLEDLFVHEAYRDQGIARELMDGVFKKVREAGCYKLIATSRDDGTRDHVHDWYLRLGFKAHGVEFRMSFEVE